MTFSPKSHLYVSRDYLCMSSDLMKTHLPSQLDIVETSSIRNLQAFVQELFEIKASTGQAVMSVVTGNVGTGKTMGGWECLKSLNPDPASLLPNWLWIDTFQYLTKESLMRAILISIEGSPLRKLRKQVTLEKVAEVLVNSEVELIVLDDADLMNTEGLELIEKLLDYSQPIVLFLGLPEFTQRLQRYERLAGVIKHFEFKMLKVDEILDVFLPSLHLPYWRFDRNCAEDRELGWYLCQQGNLSLRRLRIILQMASLVARVQGISRINRPTIEKAFELFNLKSI